MATFTRGVGQLATTRLDFQNHIDGYLFRQNAGTIDLNPPLVYDSVTVNTVQEALAAAVPYIQPPVIPDATLLSKGIIQLTGDIIGDSTTTANNITVIGLRDRPINSAVPTTGQLLGYDGNFWRPVSLSGEVSGTYSSTTVDKIKGKTINSVTPVSTHVFAYNGSTWGPSYVTIDGDVTGTSNNVVVGEATGIDDNFSIKCNNILFARTLTTPSIGQSSSSTLPGKDITISAQSTTAGLGGNVIISGGAGSTIDGGVKLKTGDGSYLLETVFLASDRRVLSLLSETAVTTTQMPANTGDMVVYIKNAATIPTASPVSGSILYSYGGALRIKQSDGTNIKIGSIPDEYIIAEETDYPEYKYQESAISAIATQTTVLTFDIPEESNLLIDYDLLGFTNTGAYYYQKRERVSVYRNVGTASIIGSITADFSATSGSWGTDPNFVIVGTDKFSIKTGFHNTIAAYWSVSISVKMVKVV